tara:strand:+ start:1006 stop:1227 length:222 start_codon:yes stop_codon:yes gene_type:complete
MMFLQDFEERLQELQKELLEIKKGAKVSKSESLRQETLKKLSFTKDAQFIREKASEKNKTLVLFETLKDLKII